MGSLSVRVFGFAHGKAGQVGENSGRVDTLVVGSENSEPVDDPDMITLPVLRRHLSSRRRRRALMFGILFRPRSALCCSFSSCLLSVSLFLFVSFFVLRFCSVSSFFVPSRSVPFPRLTEEACSTGVAECDPCCRGGSVDRIGK